MNNIIIKRFKGYPPLRLFVYGNWMQGRCDHDHFLREGAKFIGKAWLNGWGLYKVFFGNVVTAHELPQSTLNGELYAITQRGLMWCDMTSSLGMDRVNVHVNYEIPDKTALPQGGFLIEDAHGAKGVETAWIHFFARPLPQTSQVIKSIYDADDEGEEEGLT